MRSVFGSGVWDRFIFHRRQIAVHITPLQDVEIGHGDGAWRATGPAPLFLLSPIAGSFPRGWMLMRARLIRRSENYNARLSCFCTGHTSPLCYDIPATRKGTILELIRFPSGVVRMEWQPMKGSGEISQSEIVFMRAGVIERTYRKIRRILPMLWKYPLSRRRRIGLTLRNTLLNLEHTYRVAGRLRAYAPAATYREWLAYYDASFPCDTGSLLREIQRLKSPPRFALVVHVQVDGSSKLSSTIRSLLEQPYEFWELFLVMPAGKAERVHHTVMAEFPGLLVKMITSDSIADAFEVILRETTAMFLMYVVAGDALAKRGLYALANASSISPCAQVIYGDDDEVMADGARSNPHFKPQWNPDLLHSQNYIGRAVVYRASLLRKVGVGAEETAGDLAMPYQLALRCTAGVASHEVRHTAEVILHTTPKPLDDKATDQAQLRALREHLANEACSVERGAIQGTYRVRYQLPAPAPLVTLIVPTRDRVDILKKCIDSIRQKTTYPNWEAIVVDNRSVEAQTEQYLAELIKKDARFRVLRYDAPFNYSAINNYAVGFANGELVALVNNDTEVISPDWLSEMISHAMRPGIGCVGAKLYYSDDRIQHAGVIVGLGGAAGHGHRYFTRTSPGYFGRLHAIQRVSAVTAACLIVKKSIFLQVGGLNEIDLKVAFNDVDFCLKVKAAGYHNLWTPYAELYHHESLSRGSDRHARGTRRLSMEADYLRYRWNAHTSVDEYYSPWLTREREDFALLS